MNGGGRHLVTGLGALLAALLVASALVQLLPALSVLAVGADEVAGIDLMARLREARAALNGRSPYTLAGVYAPYPPATYLFFGPLLPLSGADARALWALSTLPLLVGLGWFGAARAQGGAVLRAVALLLPFGLAGVAYGVQQGQLHVHALAAAVGSLALAARPGRSLARDLLAGGLFVLALSKPTLTAPFFPLLVALPGRVRPAWVAVVGYGAATLVVCGLIGSGAEPVAQWLTNAPVGAQFGAGGSYGNVHALSALFSLTALDALCTVSLLGLAFAFGLGQIEDRADPHRLALRLAVIAVLARTFVYHQDYDDSLVLLLLFGLLARPAIGGSALPPLLLALALGALQVLPRQFLEIEGDAGSWLAIVRPVLWILGGGMCAWTLHMARPQRAP